MPNSRRPRSLRTLPGVAEVLDRPSNERAASPTRAAAISSSSPKRARGSPIRGSTEREEAPDYASHVDIHNKPGYDPCELFFGWPPMSVSMNTSKVKGTHGRADESASIAWAGSLDIKASPRTLLDLSGSVGEWCRGHI